MDNNELQHHGIKGMKWGVRRTDAQLARARGSVSPKTQQSKPAAKEEPSKKASTSSSAKPSGTLSNAELKARVERIKLEQELSKLTAPQKSKARQFIEDVLITSGKQALTRFATDKMTDFLTNSFSGSPKGNGPQTGNSRATSSNRTIDTSGED